MSRRARYTLAVKQGKTFTELEYTAASHPDFQRVVRQNRRALGFTTKTTTGTDRNTDKQSHDSPTSRSPLTKPFNRGLKRMFDITFSSIVLIALFPIILLPVAIAIKTTSKGPIFFRQRRTGHNGKEFYCWKFRTMTVTPDCDRRQARRDDPRVTSVGRFLRHTNIDELPQFYNVLRGDMSVVGPRPHMVKQTMQYSRLIDRYMMRHFIKPGITGWAQISGYRGSTSELEAMKNRVEHDVWYIDNWSFTLDLKIITTTVLNTFRGEINAY